MIIMKKYDKRPSKEWKLLWRCGTKKKAEWMAAGRRTHKVCHTGPRCFEVFVKKKKR